jgi:3-methyladenine DNA glycosylase AlkD
MTIIEIFKELSKYGNENIKKIFIRHGAKEPLFGVKVADLKKIQKKIKVNYAISLELFDTGNSDAMYLAGLIADTRKMTKKDLQKWVKKANWYMISEYTIPWVASESNFGLELAKEWINSQKENVASSGWATLASLVSIKENNELNLKEFEKLLNKVSKEIHNSQNRVRYAMNNFVISVGVYIEPLTEKALDIGKKIGKVNVEMGETSCKVPDAVEYIKKVKKLGRIGKKRKTAKC